MFVETTVIHSAARVYAFLEYAVFAVVLAAGVIVVRKSKNKFEKVMGIIFAAMGGVCLAWLIGWQIIIPLFWV